MRFSLTCCLLLGLVLPACAQDPDDPPDVDLSKPRLVLAIGGHTATVLKVFFTPDGQQLVSVGIDSSICYWDVATGELQRTLRVPSWLHPFKQASFAALSDDRKTLVLCGKYKLDKGEKTRPYVFVNVPEARIERVLRVPALNIGPNFCLGLSRDGKHLATGNHTAVAVWDIETAKLVNRFPRKCNSTAFNAAGDKLLVTAGNVLSVLDLAGGNLDKSSESLGGVHSARWLDDKQAVVCAGGALVVYDIHNQKKGRTLLGGGKLNALAWDGAAQDGLLVAGGELPKTKAPRLSLVDVVKGEERRSFPFPEGEMGKVNDVACHGPVVAAACDEVIYLWDKNSGKFLATLGAKERPPLGAGWSKDNRTIGWGGQRFNPKGKGVAERNPLERAFDLGELQFVEKAELKDFQRHVTEQGDFRLFPLRATVAKSGKSLALPVGWSIPTAGSLLAQDRVVLGMSHGGVRYYKAGTARELNRGDDAGHRAAVMGIAPSPHGRFLLTVARDHTMKVWDVSVPAQEKVLLNVFVSGQDWVVWTQQGYYAATPGGERLMGWTVNNEVGKIATFLPSARFRKQLYRPDVIKLVLEKGSVEAALKAANAALPEKDRPKTDAPADLEQLLPPRSSVKILQDAGGQVTVQVSAEAQVKSQPVVAVRLLLDGRPLPEGAGLKEFEPGQPKANIEFTLTLPPGRHTLSVLARSEDASALSEAVTVGQVVAAQQPVLHLLAIGINDYQNGIPKLNCAVNDAKDLAEAFLLVQQGNLFRDVKTHTLLDKAATAPAIRQKLAGLRPQLKNEDVLVVFFAGHGVKEGNDFFLLTAEADAAQLAKTALSGSELSRELRELRCQVLLLLDACHSGAVVKNLRNATDDAARALADDEVGVTVLAAAMGHQKALEKDGNGYFTAALKAALAGAKDVPRNPRDGRMYLHHLHGYVLDVVADRSQQRQHPFLSVPSTATPFAVRQFAKK